MIRWLIRDPDLDLVRIVVDRDAFAPGEKVGFEVRVMDASYAPAAGADVDVDFAPAVAHLEARRGRAATRFSVARRADRTGRVRFDLEPLPAGPYQIVARARHGGRALGEAREPLLVAPPAAELWDPRADPRVGRAIAAATGGTFVAEDESMPSRFELRAARVTREGERRARGYWDEPWVLLVAVAALALEWVFRRRWGFA